MLELEAGRSTYFAGPWHQWRLERAARLQSATKEAARYAEDIARLERFVARFRYKKTKAKQAQAKLTQIGRLTQEKAKVGEEISLLTRRSKRLGFGFIESAAQRPDGRRVGGARSPDRRARAAARGDVRARAR